jgi:siroheme synthase
MRARRKWKPGAGGFVSLVGAGPGDPELLTLKAARRLAEADLVHDAPVSPDLDLASGAQLLSVGKRAGGRPSRRTIHRLMIRGATRGQRIVRLKCGDPSCSGAAGRRSLSPRPGLPSRSCPA